MTQLLHSTFTAAALSAALLLSSGSSFAYGEAAPMGVIGIEAMAPVSSLDASTTDVIRAESPVQVPAVLEASTLHRWMVALRQFFDGAIEVALR